MQRDTYIYMYIYTHPCNVLVLPDGRQVGSGRILLSRLLRVAGSWGNHTTHLFKLRRTFNKHPSWQSGPRFWSHGTTAPSLHSRRPFCSAQREQAQGGKYKKKERKTEREKDRQKQYDNVGLGAREWSLSKRDVKHATR